jgi:hypothetical protein
MPEPAISSILSQESSKAIQRDQIALMLRSVVFLTCLTAILDHAKLLDWVDVLALNFLPAKEFEQKPLPDRASFRTLVLGITPDLFEQEFAGHTPINRDRFRNLIEEVAAAYPKARVLAIDYDFSPSGAQPCPFDKESSLCKIAELEAQQQKGFEEFLQAKFGGTQSLPQLQLVLITPLPFPEEHIQAKQAWLDRMGQAGVRFGDHALLYHNWLATVVKHRYVRPRSGDCLGKAEPNEMPFAAAVNEARRCAGLGPNAKVDEEEEVRLLNFAEARAAVFLCPLWQWEDIGDGCRGRLQSSNSDPDAVDTIFIGSLYGEEDKFRTPLGDQYGVDLHAFSAYSLIDPLDEPKIWSVVLDILIGMASAIVFQILWSSAMRSDHESFQRFGFIFCVFVVLACAAWSLVWVTPQWGLWMNPLTIMVGLFIDSYAGAIERVGKHKPSADATTQATMSQNFFGWPPPINLARERVFQFCKKVLFYWGVVLAGLYYMFVAG